MRRRFIHPAFRRRFGATAEEREDAGRLPWRENWGVPVPPPPWAPPERREGESDVAYLTRVSNLRDKWLDKEAAYNRELNLIARLIPTGRTIEKAWEEEDALEAAIREQYPGIDQEGIDTVIEAREAGRPDPIPAAGRAARLTPEEREEIAYEIVAEPEEAPPPRAAPIPVYAPPPAPAFDPDAIQRAIAAGMAPVMRRLKKVERRVKKRRRAPALPETAAVMALPPPPPPVFAPPALPAPVAPTTPSALLDAAEIAYRQGRTQEGWRLYRKALAVAPARSKAKVERAWDMVRAIAGTGMNLPAPIPEGPEPEVFTDEDDAPIPMTDGYRVRFAGVAGAMDYARDAERYLADGDCRLAIHHLLDARAALGDRPAKRATKRLDRIERAITKKCVVRRRPR